MVSQRFMQIVYLLCGLFLVASFGSRAAHYLSIPDFEPGFKGHLREHAELHDVTMASALPSGTIEVSAVEMRPGHETVGFFKLGPSSYLALEGVEVEWQGGDGDRWKAIGRRARLGMKTLEFESRVLVVDTDGEVRPEKRLRIDLRDGSRSRE